MTTPRSRWDDDQVQLVPVLGPGMPVRYVLVEQPIGTLAGALYLGVDDPAFGFVSADPDPAVDSAWGQRCAAAMRKTGGDGTDGFAYWSEAGNGITWDAGPVELAPDLDALRAIVAAR